MRAAKWQRLADFLAEKGFYIVLLLCVLALGASGYWIWRETTRAGLPADSRVEVVVTPAPTVRPEPPTVATPRPTAVPTPPPVPAPTAKPTPITASASVFTWPVKGTVLRGRSVETLAYDQTMGDWRVHDGVDIAAAPGTPVLAPAGGTVSDVSADDLLGTTVTILHADGVMSTCANLAGVPAVALGDLVTTGDVIGSVGGTALSESREAPHLHLSMTKDGVSVDPLDYLPQP